MFFVESSVTIHTCPKCRHIMEYRDSRIRTRKHEGGERDLLMIRRFRCTKCHRLHNELPDCLVPYKHYDAEVISGVIDGVVTCEDKDSEDYPSVITILRWLRWFQLNLANIEGYLRNAVYSIFGLEQELLYSKGSLLETIRSKYTDWLERILRVIYNSGGALVPIRW